MSGRWRGRSVPRSRTREGFVGQCILSNWFLTGKSLPSSLHWCGGAQPMPRWLLSSQMPLYLCLVLGMGQRARVQLLALLCTLVQDLTLCQCSCWRKNPPLSCAWMRSECWQLCSQYPVINGIKLVPLVRFFYFASGFLKTF